MKKQEIGFYAGSFDPFTNGHLHVVTKALRFCDKLVIGIGINQKKVNNRRYNQHLMQKAIEKICFNNGLSDVVSVICYDGLTVDAAHACGSTILVRGLRNGTDYAEEENTAQFNENYANLDTIYLRSGQIGNVSSTIVMDLIRNGKDVSDFVPKEVIEAIKSVD